MPERRAIIAIMKRTLLPLVASFVAFSAFLLGCSLGNPGSATKLSTVFFGVPTSFTGQTAQQSLAMRSVTSDAWVKSSVGSYYNTVRAQVRFGAEVARSLKALLLRLEQVKIADTYLMDSVTNLTHIDGDGNKFRWTTEGAGVFFLEMWAADDSKGLELRFTRDGTHYSGTAVAFPASLGWTDPVSPLKNPDWVKAEFDTDSDGLGTARLAFSIQGFRYHADLDPGLENGNIVLTRDSAGVVELGSIIRGDNSRHFLWNGYTLNTSNVEVLNSSISGETRYYVAAGVANTANQATVYLGIPTAVDEFVFTDNGIGDLVGALFADRLNNDYDFDGSTDIGNEHGQEIVALLNSINTSGPTLNTTGPVYTNTVADIVASLQATLSTANDTRDYLLAMMSVTNPAYFQQTTYQGYGASVPAGWLTLAEADARARDSIPDRSTKGRRSRRHFEADQSGVPPPGTPVPRLVPVTRDFDRDPVRRVGNSG